jgi:hypothetical protein
MLNQTVHLWYLVIQEADERPTLAEKMVPSFTRKKWSRHIYNARYSRVLRCNQAQYWNHWHKLLGYTPKHARNLTMQEMIEAAISIAKTEETIYALCKEDQILQVFGCRNKKISVFLDEQNSSKSWKWKWNALLQVS